jgi:hypothetical protein
MNHPAAMSAPALPAESFRRFGVDLKRVPVIVIGAIVAAGSLTSRAGDLLCGVNALRHCGGALACACAGFMGFRGPGKESFSTGPRPEGLKSWRYSRADSHFSNDPLLILLIWENLLTSLKIVASHRPTFAL